MRLIRYGVRNGFNILLRVISNLYPSGFAVLDLMYIQCAVKHLDFEKLGYDLIACFDNDREKVGTKIGEQTIKDVSEIDDFCAENKVEVVILCIPKENVENILDKLYGFGIRNFWNFSHYDITSRYNDAVVENVHLNDSLMTLCYRISNA